VCGGGVVALLSLFQVCVEGCVSWDRDDGLGDCDWYSDLDIVSTVHFLGQSHFYFYFGAVRHALVALSFPCADWGWQSPVTRLGLGLGSRLQASSSRFT